MNRTRGLALALAGLILSATPVEAMSRRRTPDAAVDAARRGRGERPRRHRTPRDRTGSSTLRPQVQPAASPAAPTVRRARLRRSVRDAVPAIVGAGTVLSAALGFAHIAAAHPSIAPLLGIVGPLGALVVGILAALGLDAALPARATPPAPAPPSDDRA